MQTPLTADASSVAEQVKNDAHTLGKEVAKMAHDHVVEPVREKLLQPAASLAHDARTAVTGGAKHLQDAVHDGIASTRKVLADTVAHTQESATVQRDRVSAWISANPFAAVGIAMVAGAVLTSISHHRNS